MMKKTISIIGSGNWGSAISRNIGYNAARLPQFNTEVRMWVHEEIVEGRNLSEIINEKHENIKYLPNIKLPENIIADPDFEHVVEDADILVFVVPHQFLQSQINKIKEVYTKIGRTKKVLGVSLIKGIIIEKDGPKLISEDVCDQLSWCDECAVLMGANIAKDVAEDTFCESTLGCKNEENGKLLASVFQTDTFDIQVSNQVPGVELCGALKNIVALGAGLSRGLDLSPSTTAAIIRIGLEEMMRFNNLYFDNVDPNIYFMSCGVADLIATCEGGRNQRVSAEWAKSQDKSWQTLEKELLNGQKLQGTITLNETIIALKHRNAVDQFPLFSTLYKIFFENHSKLLFLSLFKSTRQSL